MLISVACSNIDLSKLSDKDLEKVSKELIVCNQPYIRYSTGCCLDKNNNAICDNDEAEKVTKETPSSTTSPATEIPAQPKSKENTMQDENYISFSGKIDMKILGDGYNAKVSDKYVVWYNPFINKNMYYNLQTGENKTLNIGVIDFDLYGNRLGYGNILYDLNTNKEEKIGEGSGKLYFNDKYLVWVDGSLGGGILVYDLKTNKKTKILDIGTSRENQLVARLFDDKIVWFYTLDSYIHINDIKSNKETLYDTQSYNFLKDHGIGSSNLAV